MPTNESVPAHAIPLGKAPGDWSGDAQLFRLDPPLSDGTSVVVSSAVDLRPSIVAIDSIFGNGYRTSETMVFPWDEVAGKITSWGELAMVPTKSHVEALEDLGYEVTE